jgi:hypothetical protein
VGFLDNLNIQTLNGSQRRATPKSAIVPRVVAQEEKKKAKVGKDKAFRDAIWALDQGVCRATGVPLSRSGMDPHRVGEVDHVLNRSTHPALIYEVSNGILISKYLNRLKKVACPQAPEFFMFSISGPADRRKPQKFTWRDKAGKIIKEAVG